MNLFLDPSFYLLLSFLLFIGIIIGKLKEKVIFYLQKKIDAIASDINQAACEKDEALLSYTRIHTITANLPEEIASIMEEEDLDEATLQAQENEELNRMQSWQDIQLELCKKRLIQKEYANVLENVAQTFQENVRNASPAQQQALTDQAIDLLARVDLADCLR